MSAAFRVVMLVHEFPKRSEAFLVDKFLGLLRAGLDVHLLAERRGAADFEGYPELRTEPAVRGRLHLWPERERLPALLSRMLLASVSFLFRSPREALATWRSVGRHPVAERPGRFAYLARLRALAPDVVHCEFGTLAARRPELLAHTAWRTVVSYRGWDVNYDGLDRPERIAAVFAAADAFHFLGRDLHVRALRRGLRANATVSLIPPAVDPLRFVAAPRPRSPGENVLRIVAVGRLHWKKGYEHALRALRRVAQAGVRFDYRVIGEGPFATAVETCVRDLDLDDSVTLVGPLDRDGVARELAQADLMLHAAVSEGFCNAVIEAQAMGVPVVCSDADGLAENVAHEETGLVVARRDVKAMADAILALALDPERRAEMSARGAARVREQFAPASQIAAFIALYEATQTSAGRGEDRRESRASTRCTTD